MFSDELRADRTVFWRQEPCEAEFSDPFYVDIERGGPSSPSFGSSGRAVRDARRLRLLVVNGWPANLERPGRSVCALAVLVGTHEGTKRSCLDVPEVNRC